MRITRKFAGLVVTAGIALALIGAGVNASYTDSGSATDHVTVGTFGCALSSTDPNMVISNGGHTATLNWPAINSSAAGSAYSNLTVTNTGSMAAIVHWTEATSGTITWQPTGRMGYTIGSTGNLLSTDLNLAAGANHSYSSLGFQWATLTNADLGASASVSYTANCSEVPPAPVSHISFVGAVDAVTSTSHAVSLPASAVAGDFAISYGLDGNSASYPSGWTQIGFGTSGYLYYTTSAWHVLTSADITAGKITFPSTTQRALVAVYRGVARIGSHSVSNPGNNQYWGCTTGALTVTNGTSWVVCYGGDGRGTFNVASHYAPAVWGTTLRSGGFADTLTGLSDTNGGVSSWAPPSYASGDYANGGANYGLELVSQ